MNRREQGVLDGLVSKEQMTGEWNRLADKPEFKKARKNIPMMAPMISISVIASMTALLNDIKDSY